MDKDTHPGHEPEHVDLTQIEGKPGARGDPMFERQTDDTEIMGLWFGARFSRDNPVRSSAGTATGTTTLRAALRAVLGRGPVRWPTHQSKGQRLTKPDAGLERCLAGSRHKNSSTSDPTAIQGSAHAGPGRRVAHHKRHQ